MAKRYDKMPVGKTVVSEVVRVAKHMFENEEGVKMSVMFDGGGRFLFPEGNGKVKDKRIHGLSKAERGQKYLDDSSDEEEYLPTKKIKPDEIYVPRSSKNAVPSTPTRRSRRIASSDSSQSSSNDIQMLDALEHDQPSSLFFTQLPFDIRVIVYQNLYQSLEEDGEMSCVKLGATWCPDSVAVIFDTDVDNESVHSNSEEDDTDDDTNDDDAEYDGEADDDEEADYEEADNEEAGNDEEVEDAEETEYDDQEEEQEDDPDDFESDSDGSEDFDESEDSNGEQGQEGSMPEDDALLNSHYRWKNPTPLPGHLLHARRYVRINLHHLPPRDGNENGQNGRKFQFRYQVVMQDANLFNPLRKSLKGDMTIRKLEISLLVWISDAEILRNWDHHYYPVVDVKSGVFKLIPVIKKLENLDTLMVCRPDFNEICAEDERLGDECSKRFEKAIFDLGKRILGDDVLEWIEEAPYAAGNWISEEEQVSYRYVFKKNNKT
ncbi:hypothetical protein BDV96DRAFT_652263 [Lophiotrema nucula]|uniref:Uncharacterized protein n=1 Tax=Lophiotrema nucula TaxID=690887 RepID=A0A6A5YPZ4_9PLEO|nr:hypothetical protein BDV96DRAFT_652263 [Lophiotrema nucula]